MFFFVYYCCYAGKLDPKNLFDNGSEDKENEANRRSSMVIGKLNAKNLFENNSESEKVESFKSSIQVGKINTKDIFTESNESKPLSRIDIKVGKLKIKENLKIDFGLKNLHRAGHGIYLVIRDKKPIFTFFMTGEFV